MSGPLLEVQDLAVDFLADEGLIQAVRGVSFTIERGQTVALVGESGSGKTVVSQAILGILPQSARITRGAIILRDPQRGHEPLDLAAYPDDHPVRRSIRGGADLDHFPGADELAFAAAHDRRSDQRGAAAALRCRPRRGRAPHGRDAAAGSASPIRPRPSAPTRSSCRAACASGR